MEGTFFAEEAVHRFMPEEVPQPLGWGTYKSEPDRHFYICSFVDMFDEVPNASQWADLVSRLHIRSEGKGPKSLSGKDIFGFGITTHLADVPVDNNWQDSREGFWTQQMQSLFQQEAHACGTDEGFARLQSTLCEKVIPRLLGPLEIGGGSVTACLIHSDLWLGNVKLDSKSERLYMFDACAYWGHHEGIRPEIYSMQ